jgi:hypothetical protein
LCLLQSTQSKKPPNGRHAVTGELLLCVVFIHSSNNKQDRSASIIFFNLLLYSNTHLTHHLFQPPYHNHSSNNKQDRSASPVFFKFDDFSFKKGPNDAAADEFDENDDDDDDHDDDDGGDDDDDNDDVVSFCENAADRQEATRRRLQNVSVNE